MEYANKVKAYAAEAKDDLHIIMRVYFEKCVRARLPVARAFAESNECRPRTTVGWKGLINGASAGVVDLDIVC